MENADKSLLCTVVYCPVPYQGNDLEYSMNDTYRKDLLKNLSRKQFVLKRIFSPLAFDS